MRFDQKFRDRGQATLLAIGLACFIVGYFVNQKADAVLDMLFAGCVFGMICLEIVCRRRRPGQPVWTRRARINILWAGLYLMLFAVHAALVLAEVRLPAGIRSIMSLLGALSLIALLLHDRRTAPKSRKRP